MDKLEAITLENDLQYVIISTLNHKENAYILVANITGEETGDELEIFRATQGESGLSVENIEDENLYNEVKNIFDEKLKRFAQNNA
ncbi:MAG: DUF1292 domain-containing protein [Bacilli bacterium]|nr:DUF1292 domain-containing protein [Bacilli bacterium]